MSRSAHPAGPRYADVLPEGGHGAAPADVNRLDRKIWPGGVARDADSGALSFAGADVRELAREYGTPAYLIDEDDWRRRAREWVEAFGADADVFYAGKSFLSVAIAKWAADEGLHLDVCSGGELAVALRAGFPASRLGFHGNNKSVAELERAVDAGVGRIIVDSHDEIERLAAIAADRGVRQRVMVRVTAGVEAHTHEFIATAHEDQKFGFSLAGGAAAEAVTRILKHAEHLELTGLHSHIGSQIFDTAGFEVAAHRLTEALAAIRRDHGIELPELDLGGGLGIAYTEADDPAPVAEIAARLKEIVARECDAAGLAHPRLSVEPGRAIAGPPGITLYEVGTVKPLPGLRTYVSVDGGMSDNIRTSLYDAEYTVSLVSRASRAEAALTRVVGKHCESGDIVVRDAWLPGDTAPGDLLAVAATGAYCRSMASNYNHLLKPPVIAVKDGAARVIVRRETEDDLLGLDLG
ncbi:diaminopimelate decarboxylase [Catenulispora sp. NF23]|uniref:Diaminopimelate decarboxylase n=1 Tax=Catenulispora pinistramenti TaxID=2705254 RepID=A0ABS5L2V1_9ACTN|nr:diaminopimelate decarboxylase [Catenulispora pinistramenti]MBS2535534.1 diaminopimelate decarboxylase [Catenulispora pinistramenti]MBS2552580.1 diaminopimelate decarboxylase [Catenulispora pinistramenti]